MRDHQAGGGTVASSHPAPAAPWIFRSATQLRNARRLTALAPLATDVEHRALVDYDRVFGLDEVA